MLRFELSFLWRKGKIRTPQTVRSVVGLRRGSIKISIQLTLENSLQESRYGPGSCYHDRRVPTLWKVERGRVERGRERERGFVYLLVATRRT